MTLVAHPMQFYENYIFPRFFDSVLKHQGFEHERAQTLSAVRGRILEIGIGTGLNLDFYPHWVKRIDAIEPNPGMRKQLWKKTDSHRIEVLCRCAVAEQLPYAAESFDTVVSTFTLCSLGNIQRGLSEIKRVLAPGGKFLFMDHGLSDDGPTAVAQKIFNPLQALVGCGCRLTVDVEGELMRAGFLLERCDKSFIGSGPKILGFVYRGVAHPRTFDFKRSQIDLPIRMRKTLR